MYLLFVRVLYLCHELVNFLTRLTKDSRVASGVLAPGWREGSSSVVSLLLVQYREVANYIVQLVHASQASYSLFSGSAKR